MSFIFNKTSIFSAFIAVFAVALIIPTYLSLFTQQNTSLEKRILSTKPRTPENITELRNYPGKFEDYYRDNMGFRGWLTSFYSHALLILGTSSVENVIVGKDDWLFYAGERIIEDYRKTEPFSQSQLQQWGDNLVKKHQTLKSMGITYLFVVAPNKPSIYPEMLPAHILPTNGISRLDQLLGYLDKNTEVNYLDLRPILKKHKSKGQPLYWPRDTHWNRLGAKLGFQAIVSKLRNLGFDISGISNELWKDEYERSQDLSMMLGLTNDLTLKSLSYSEQHVPCAKNLKIDNTWPKGSLEVKNVFTSNCEGEKFNVVVFRDSFATELAPLFTNSFKTAKFIWTLPDEKAFEYFVSPETSIVIEQRVERSLRILPYPKEWTLTFQKIADSKLNQSFNSAKTTTFILDKYNAPQARVLNGEVSKSMPLTVTTKHWNSQLFFPNIPFTGDSEHLVQLKIESPIANEVRLFFQTDEKPHFNAQNMMTRKINKGINTLYFKLSNVKKMSAMRLDPSRAKGTFVISSLQIKKYN